MAQKGPFLRKPQVSLMLDLPSSLLLPVSPRSTLRTGLTKKVDALATYKKLTGAVEDVDTGLLKITAAQFANLQPLFFNVGGVRL